MKIVQLLRKIFGPPICPICGKEGSGYISGGYCVDCDIKRIEKMAEILSRHKAELEKMNPKDSGKVIDNFFRN